MCVLPLEDAPEREFGVMEAGPDRPEPAADDASDVLVGHPLEEPEDEHLAMLGPQAVERGVDPAGVFGREVVVPDRSGEVALVDRTARPPSLAEQAGGPISRQPIEPGGQRPGVVQPRHAAKDLDPDILERVVGVVVFAEHLRQVIPETRPISPDDLGKRGLVPRLAAEHEHPFIDPIGDLGHSRPARDGGRSGDYRGGCAPRVESSNPREVGGQTRHPSRPPVLPQPDRRTNRRGDRTRLSRLSLGRI
jgi:hypothetical protein